VTIAGHAPVSDSSPLQVCDMMLVKCDELKPSTIEAYVSNTWMAPFCCYGTRNGGLFQTDNSGKL
jgi:hypothetical protein